MYMKYFLRLCLSVIALFGIWGIFALIISKQSGTQMGLLGQIAFNLFLPNIVWLIIAYWLIKHFSIDGIKKYFQESEEHRKRLEEKLDEICKKLESKSSP